MLRSSLPCTGRGCEAHAEKVRFWCLVLLGVSINSAPVGELALMAGQQGRNASTGEWIAPTWQGYDTDRPAPLSGHGVYAGCGCPYVGWTFTVLFLGFGCVLLVRGVLNVYRRTSKARDDFVKKIAEPWSKSLTRKLGWRLMLAQARVRRGFALVQLYHSMTEGGAGGKLHTDIVPERYLEAFFEQFILSMIIAWTLTCLYNPDIISRNRLRDIVGYNNVCVGFDSEPARSVMVPMFCFQSYLGIRYVHLDSMRAEIHSRDVGYKKLARHKRYARIGSNPDLSPRASERRSVRAYAAR